jgi:predicted ATPase
MAIDEALSLSASTGEIWCMPELLRIKADLLGKEGDHRTDKPAEALYVQAIDLARRQGALSWELRAATALAEHWLRTDQDVKAAGVLAPVYGRFNDGFATRDLARARELLNVLKDVGRRRAAAVPVTRRAKRTQSAPEQ